MTPHTGSFYEPDPKAAAGPGDSQSLWDVALICLNGHVVNERSRGNPAGNAPRCSTCGAETIAACPGCRDFIPGFRYDEAPAFGPGNQPGHSLGKVPQYCHSCGRPFPWTERAMSAARAVIRELASLDQYERDQLRRSIDHIIRETPQTQVAIVRIRQALVRIGGDTAAQLREILRCVASETVRKQLFPDETA